MANRSKAKGSSFESQCVAYLRERLDDNGIERRALHGNNDMGDVFGLHAHGFTGIIECKNHKSYGPSDIMKWQAQTVAERENSGADFAVLLVHKAGVGRATFGRNTAYLQVRDLEKVAGNVAERYPHDPFLDVWVRVPFETVCDLMLYEPIRPWL